MCHCNPDQAYICPDCNGKKKINKVPCKRCKGTGRISTTEIGLDEIVEVAPYEKKSS